MILDLFLTVATNHFDGLRVQVLTTKKIMQATNIPESGSLRTTISFSISDHLGALDDALQILKENSINLTRIESRPSKTADWDYDFFVDFETPEDEKKLDSILKSLEPAVKNVRLVGKGPNQLKGTVATDHVCEIFT